MPDGLATLKRGRLCKKIEYNELLKIVNDLVEIGGGELDSDVDNNCLRIMTNNYQIWFDMSKREIEIELAYDNFYITIKVDKENYKNAAYYLKYKA